MNGYDVKTKEVARVLAVLSALTAGVGLPAEARRRQWIGRRPPQ